VNAHAAEDPLLHCPYCGAAMVADGRFCGDCGAPVPSSAVPVPQPQAQPPAPVRDTRPSLGALRLEELLPVGAWWRAQGWRRGQDALFLAIAVAPFVVLQVTSDDSTVEGAAVGFAIYFAVLWLLAIRAMVRPEPLGWVVPAAIVGFTSVAGVALAIAVEEWLAADSDSLLSSILTVGLPEELAKALPVILLLRVGRGRWAPRTFLFAGAISGLAFGAAEAVTYTVAYSSALDLDDGGLVVSLWRLLCGSLFHGCMAGIVAFFVGLAAWYPGVRWHLVGFGLTIAGVLHGLYDYFSDGWGGTLLATVTVFAFVEYLRSEDHIGSRLAATVAP
jgi:RsiW-degrading membrane proteinase PrsW (M82 family)